MTSRALKGASLNMWDQFCLSQTKLVSGPVSNRYAIIPEPVLRGAVIQLP